MFDRLKPGFNAFLRPAMKFFARLGVHPNHITIFGVILFAGSGFLTAIGLDYWLWAFALLVFGSFMDGIDGQLAREYGKKSVFGSILDSSCDRITEILFLAGLLVFYMNDPELRTWGVYLCYATIAGSVMVSYVKACCDGVGVKCSRGFMQRPERLFLFGTGLVFGPVAMLWIIGIISLLSIITAMERLVSAAIKCKRNEEAEAASCQKK